MKSVRFVSLCAALLTGLITLQSNSVHANQLNAAPDAQKLIAAQLAGENSPSSIPLIFAPAVSYGSGGHNTFSVAMGDLNGDGKADLVATSNSGVGVLLGNGNGTFQSAVNYAIGGIYPDSVAIADVNNDGKPDLIVSSCADICDGDDNGIVSVFLGNGDGTFQPAVNYSVGAANVSAVAVGDVNGDGKPDLVLASLQGPPGLDGAVSVLLGNGNGTFQSAVVYDSNGQDALSVAIGDVNGDGKLDLVVTNYYGLGSQGRGGCVSVLLGNGNGTFQTAVSYETGYDTASVAIGDVNGDHKPDLVVTNNQANTVGVLLGNGNGTFQPIISYSSGFAPQSIVIADVNGDGKLDLAVSNGNGLAMLLGNGDGTFQAPVSYDPGGEDAEQVVIGDVNGDGKPDMVVANYCESDLCDSGGVGVLLNNSSAPPTTTSLVASVDPVNLQQKIAYTATVVGQSGGTVNGSVEFRDGYSPQATVTLVGNQAVYSTSYTAKNATGAHSITAAYTGVYNVSEGSQSSTLTEYVRSALTKTALTTSGSPSVVGQPVTFTATVTSTKGAIPNGDLVTFYDGSKVLASVPLAGGVATYTTSSLSAKTHLIKATYVGDDTFEPSSIHISQVVQP